MLAQVADTSINHHSLNFLCLCTRRHESSPHGSLDAFRFALEGKAFFPPLRIDIFFLYLEVQRSQQRLLLWRHLPMYKQEIYIYIYKTKAPVVYAVSLPSYKML